MLPAGAFGGSSRATFDLVKLDELRHIIRITRLQGWRLSMHARDPTYSGACAEPSPGTLDADRRELVCPWIMSEATALYYAVTADGVVLDRVQSSSWRPTWLPADPKRGLLLLNFGYLHARPCRSRPRSSRRPVVYRPGRDGAVAVGRYWDVSIRTVADESPRPQRGATLLEAVEAGARRRHHQIGALSIRGTDSSTILGL